MSVPTSNSKHIIFFVNIIYYKNTNQKNNHMKMIFHIIFITIFIPTPRWNPKSALNS
jgi:hypothetical protein